MEVEELFALVHERVKSPETGEEVDTFLDSLNFIDVYDEITRNVNLTDKEKYVLGALIKERLSDIVDNIYQSHVSAVVDYLYGSDVDRFDKVTRKIMSTYDDCELCKETYGPLSERRVKNLVKKAFEFVS